MTLECLFTGPEHKVKWYKNGKEILFDKEVTRAHLCYLVNDINVQAYKLIFSKISLAARGKYKLQIGNESCECNLDITGTINYLKTRVAIFDLKYCHKLL